MVGSKLEEKIIDFSVGVAGYEALKKCVMPFIIILQMTKEFLL